MNKRLVAYMQGAVLLIEAACMTPALVIALFQQDGDAWALGATMLILIAIGAPLRFLVRPGERNLRAREGFLTVALAWIALSCFGALPFVFSGMIPCPASRQRAQPCWRTSITCRRESCSGAPSRTGLAAWAYWC